MPSSARRAGARRRSLPAAVLALCLGLGLGLRPAPGVLLGVGDGVANTRAPRGLPVWGHLGHSRGLSAVYLGNGWVLTAAHVGAGDVVLAGTRHAALEGSARHLEDPDGQKAPPDLVLFRIEPRPDLPALAIRSVEPRVGEPVWMAGHGRDRGERLLWRGLPGWHWAGSQSLRWGTNRVHETGVAFEAHGMRTRSFSLRFDEQGTPYEAQAAHGDSGGAVFMLREGRWELAGLLHSVSVFEHQPAESSVFGNQSYAADLSAYGDQIRRVVAGDGVALLPFSRSPERRKGEGKRQ